MNKILSSFYCAASALIGSISFFLGEWDILLKSIFCLVVLDYITGILKAIYNKELSSVVGIKGIIKKIAVFIVIAVSNIIQLVLDDKIPLREIIITFYSINESISIIENAAQFIPIPSKIKDILAQMKQENEKK